MVALSYIKRRKAEKAQPQFWRYAGAEAEINQAKWFEELLAHNDYIMLSAEENFDVVGFIIGRLLPAPEVYDPGGLTLMIDDFCVKDETSWNLAGDQLVQEIKKLAKEKGAAQILVVSGAWDKAKIEFLKSQNLSVASEWYVGEIV